MSFKDQLVVIEHAATAGAFMRIHNPDGFPAGACGNATRCVVAMLMQQSRRDEVAIRIVSGDLLAPPQPLR